MKQNNKYKVIGWDVDTQVDFMQGVEDNSIGYEGKLKIENAMQIAPKLKQLTNYLRENQIPIFGSVDWHNKDSKEFPQNNQEPNFQTTFPQHCVKETYGAQKIKETQPENPLWIDWNKQSNPNDLTQKIRQHQGEVFFRKDNFDVFEPEESQISGVGNPYAKQIIENLGIEKAIVYGVALEVCNNFAIQGLQNLGVQVYAVEDAMKAINGEARPQILDSWRKQGAKIVKLDNILKGEY